MLNPEEKGKMTNKTPQEHHQSETYKTAVLNLQLTLDKHPQHHHQADQLIINEFISLSPYLKDVSQQISIDFARNIVRKSKVHYVHGKKKIYEKGQAMKVIFMPLCGGIYLRNSIINDVSKDLKTIFDPLITSVKKHPVQLKHHIFLEKRHSIQSQFNVTAVPHWQDLTNMIPLEKEGCLMIGDLENEKYSEGLYIKGEGWVLGIETKKFHQCLIEEYDRSIMKQAFYFRTIRCFDILEDSELKKFIEQIQLAEFKKDQCIYREGDTSKYLYLLVEGEAKVTKMAELFKEDPNSLYQRAVKSQSSRRSQRPAQLSYVNFEGVYNYSPQLRRIQLGILSPVTIFGDEEISPSSLSFRQTQVQVISSQLKAYRFTLKELETAGNGRKIDTAKFMSDLYDYLTEKRILKRRQNLRSSLQLQNKRNMNYFFIDAQSIGSKRSKSSRIKINSCICQSPSKTERPKSAVKPRYHNLNFNEFIQPSGKTRETNLSLIQKQVSKLTHNSSDIVQKVQKQLTLFTKLQGYKHKINIDTPLFDSNYYKKQRKEMLRIQNKRRMNKIEVKGVLDRSRSKKDKN